MSVVEKLEEAIYKKRWKVPDGLGLGKIEVVSLSDFQREFVAFKKDYDNEIHVPKRLFKDGKYVERIKVLLSDYVIMPRKKLEEIVAMIDKQMDSATNLIPCKAPCARDVENTYIKIKELLEVEKTK